jgi:hypothetical protein
MGGYLGQNCSRCGKAKTKGAVFYIVRMTLTADFDGELEELDPGEVEPEMKRQIKKAERMSEKELMDEVFQEWYFYLCKGCRDWFVEQPAARGIFQGADNG